MTELHIIDSHTGGEPTRVVVSDIPDLTGLSAAEALVELRDHHDYIRTGCILEPRGSDVLVGAFLLPARGSVAAGVVFFNNAGYLGMCGHGSIGLVATLAYMGKIQPGRIEIDTPVGPIHATLHDDGSVEIENVPSRRTAKGVKLDVPGFGEVVGDVAWGGNWFFLTENRPCAVDLAHVEELSDFTRAIRDALERNGVTGDDGAFIDHIEVFAPSPTADSRNFVLCPGLAYDRSPCGTGTSAKIACLIADGKLAEGENWVQESVIGSQFRASGRIVDGLIVPTIRGSAFVTGEGKLRFDRSDPFRFGIRS